MGNLMERLYDNIDQAKAFAISFNNFVHIYDDKCEYDFTTLACDSCGHTAQISDYLVPKANCKKPYGILSTCEFGINEELRNQLIENFDITEKDFRPVRNKKGDIVFYQITPQHTMLPIYKENHWIQYRPCPKCGSIQYSDSNFENEQGEQYYYISQTALDEMHDINVTCEKFQCHLPLFIISRRVYDFLIEKHPRSHYFPLFLKQE